MTQHNESGIAAELQGANKIIVKETPARVPETGEVLLQILYAGICGTDLALYHGNYPVPLPLVLGHEYSAIVEAVGNGVNPDLIGKRVVCEINNSCKAYNRPDLCVACQRGMENHCLTRTVTGIIYHPGAFSTWLTIPAGNIHELPEAIPDDVAIFIEPLAAAIRTFELTRINSGDWVVVLGSGRLGRLIALVANSMGARVITSARSKASLDFVREFSKLSIQIDARGETADFAEQVESLDEMRHLVLDATGGLGADIVVEATGQNDLLNAAATLARPEGTVCLKSTSGLPAREVNTTLHTVNELRFQGSRCGSFAKAIDFMMEIELPDRTWISRVMELENIQEALAAATELPKVVLKIKN